MSFSIQALSLKYQQFDNSKHEEKTQEDPKRKRMDWSEDQGRENSAD